MKTINDSEEFDPATAWMKNVEEVSRRFREDPESFAANYPDRFRELIETRNQMAMNDPMVFIGLIKLNIQLLPEAIEAAQRGINPDKIRKLTELQHTIQDMLIPKIPVHRTVRDYINKHEEILNGYLLHVLSLKQKIEDPKTASVLQMSNIPEKTITISDTGKSKKPAARAFANFTDKLQNGFTEDDLNALLIHVNFKNNAGQTIISTKYLMHHVIDALVKEGYFDRGNIELDQKALSRYLGIKETRVTVEQGKPKKSVRKKAESYLSELKNKRKINR